MKLVTIATALCICFYLMTALVGGNGGPSDKIVLKPFHGLLPFYGGGEEGSWKKFYRTEPWWIKGDYLQIYYSSSETTVSYPVLIYTLGFYLTVLLIPTVIILNLGRSHRYRNTAEQGAAANP